MGGGASGGEPGPVGGGGPAPGVGPPPGAERHGEQGALFGAEVAGRLGSAGDGGVRADDAPDVGYRGPIAAKAAGITYRQLDYWARTGLVEPSVRSASGSGTARLYSFRDILVLKVVKRLLDTGVSLHNIRAAIGHLRSRGIGDLARITLLSDGASVYECRSADEVVDLLAGGQGVFGIAVGRVVEEVEGSLAALPRERLAGADAGVESDETTAGSGSARAPQSAARHGTDELSSRRRRRSSA